MHFIRLISGLTLFAIATTAMAADLVFAAPPRGTMEAERQLYQPIADLLTKTLGVPVVLRYSASWAGYAAGMRKDEYDIVFDGPHFIGWRMAKLGHTPLVRLDGDLAFAVAALSDNQHVKKLGDLAGRRVCGFAPPNLATMALYELFPNPARQPVVVEMRKGFKEAYDGIINKTCDAGVMQASLYARFAESDKGRTRVLEKTKPLPNQGFSASRRITPDMQKKITEALLSPAGQTATAALRAELKKNFMAAKPAEYEGLGALLKNEIGFEL